MQHGVNVPSGLTNVVSISASGYSGLALTADGRVMGWGEISPPSGLSNVVAISAGGGSGYPFGLALTRNGTVVAWGDNSFHESIVPPGLSNIVAIATGESTGLALLSSGTIVTWGYNGGAGLVPAGLTNLMALTAASENGMALVNSGAPQIMQQPAAQMTGRGTTVTFSTFATGAPSLQYQWLFDGMYLDSATNASLVLSNVDPTEAGTYTVLVSNQFGFVVSSNVTLTVVTNPVFIVQPTNQMVYFGSNAIISATAIGTIPLSYQWQLDGTNLPSATSSTLLLTDVQPANGGVYALVVSNSDGTTVSSNAVLSPVPYLVFGWGWNEDELGNYAGQSTPPIGLTNVMALAAGGDHSMALNKDGTVVAWGDDGAGETAVPSGLNATAVAAGWRNCLALEAGGTVVAWGDNSYGQSSVPPGLSNVAAISAGGTDVGGFSVALKNDGTVVAWGSVAAPAGLTNLLAVSAGGDHCLGLKNDYTVVGWGNNNVGQATPPAGLSNVVAVAAGDYFSLALRDDGTVVAWGNNSWGRTNVPAGLSNVVALATGGAHVIALLNDGSITIWGDSEFGLVPVPSTLANAYGVAAGRYHRLAVAGDGSPTFVRQAFNQTVYSGMNVRLCPGVVGSSLLLQWQLNGTNIPGATNALLVLSNVQPADAGIYTLLANNDLGATSSSNALLTVITSPPVFTSQPSNTVSFGGRNIVLNANVIGSVPLSYQWQLNGTNFPNATNATLTLSNLQWSSAGVYTLVVSNQYGVTISSNAVLSMPSSEVIAWGSDISGQTNVPVALTNVVAVAAGNENSLALQADGTAVGWGANNMRETATPKGLSNFVAIATSQSGTYEFTLGLRNDGTVVGWGNNSTGQTNIPAGLSNVIAIAAGQMHSLALRVDGKVFAWGNNSSGQTNVPISLTNATAIAAGLNFSLALTPNGNIIGWGDNSSGQTNVPAGLTNVMAIAAGSSHCLALRSDGTVVAWGANNYGQINVPAGLSNVVAISAGAYHSLAIRNDGTMVAWGQNIYGQTNVPQGVNLAVMASGGAEHTVALLEGGPLVMVQQPASQIVDAGNSAWWRPEMLGGNPVSYQWLLNGTNLPGATNAFLSFVNVQPANAGTYTLVASNSYGLILSSNAILTVLTHPPAFTQQPSNLMVLVGANAVFSPSVSGTPPLACQWQLDGTNLPGATNLALSITNVQSTNLGTYALIVTNAYGSAVSVNASLAFMDLGYALNATDLVWSSGGTSPWFPETNWTHDGIAAVQSGKISSFQSSTLQTIVTGPGTLTFWYENYSMGTLSFAINGATQMSVSTFPSWQQRTYYLGTGIQTLLWTYSAGFFAYGSNAVWIDQVSLTPGGTAPFVTTSPTNQTVKYGTNVSFSAAAAGTPPLLYQWQFNGTNLPNATQTTLSLTNVQTTNSGSYNVVVYNLYGTTASPNATLIVREPLFSTAPGSLGLTSQGFSMQINGLTGHGPITIYSSTNLLNWIPVCTNPPASGTLQFLDTNVASQPVQFYRAVEQ